MDNFITFLESLRTEDNSSTIDTIMEGYSVANMNESIYHSIPFKMNATMIDLIQKARILEKHFKELIAFVKSVDLDYIVDYIKTVITQIKEAVKNYNVDQTLIRQVNQVLRYIQNTVAAVKSRESVETDQIYSITDSIMMDMLDMVSLYGKYKAKNQPTRPVLSTPIIYAKQR